MANDWSRAAVEIILKDRHLNYSTVNSRQLNGLNESQLMAYRLMIVPGGNFIAIGNGLTSSTTAHIHNAAAGVHRAKSGIRDPFTLGILSAPACGGLEGVKRKVRWTFRSPETRSAVRDGQSEARGRGPPQDGR